MFHSTDLSYYIISLGCSKNLVDSEKINGAMSSAGFSSVSSSEDADILIINTCGFITPAKEESIGVIFDALEQRDASAGNMERPFGKKVVVTGCLTQRYYSDIRNDIPEIDFIDGVPDENFVGKISTAFHISLDGRLQRDQVPLEKGTAFAYIKISEGCSNNCAYCTIPFIRGSHVSFSPTEILHDARQALKRGAREIIIIAQDTASYNWNGTGLAEIVNMISELPGVDWIRLMYCHPDHITDEIVGLLADNKKVVKYVDVPFQHASGPILKSMGRRGNFDSYLELVLKLRERVTGIRIRSTFMVGHPGETGGDFARLMEFIEKAQLDRVGAFMYSPEEGTRSVSLDGKVSARVMKKRYNQLMKLQQVISREKLKGMIGSTVNVLVEERLDEKTCVGRSEFDAPEVDGVFYLTTTMDLINTIVRARVTDAVEYDLIGETLENTGI
ncbi:MAG: 30S ribosomal protein S12 methylthiotransferase RimO [Spirochaetae bacterium HGW-Spirochaetae-1]|nr:MAG: 30S ribosomal protein S12 methylthiotransferase RimO [Spirochaetae bacterium HGW-Spirochaetae-1]